MITSIKRILYLLRDRVTYMFVGCDSLVGIGVKNIGSSNITDVSNIFSNCSHLKGLDLSDFSKKKRSG